MCHYGSECICVGTFWSVVVASAYTTIRGSCIFYLTFHVNTVFPSVQWFFHLTLFTWAVWCCTWSCLGFVSLVMCGWIDVTGLARIFRPVKTFELAIPGSKGQGVSDSILHLFAWWATIFLLRRLPAVKSWLQVSRVCRQGISTVNWSPGVSTPPPLSQPRKNSLRHRLTYLRILSWWVGVIRLILGSSIAAIFFGAHLVDAGLCKILDVVIVRHWHSGR